MSDTKAFKYFINPNGSSSDEDNAVHQVSPAWVLTFIRWKNRDTYRDKNDSSTDTFSPLVVENDCLQVSVNSNKGTLTPSMNATLVMTDVDYESAIFPGDFVIVNMLNWPSDARKVADKAKAKKPINLVNDGFKGIFKVQGVRRILTTDPQSGTRIVIFKINGFAFTEFNNTIYFNPYLIDPQQDKKNELLFASYIGKDWTKLVNAKGLVDVQDIISALIESFIGSGIKDDGSFQKTGAVKTPNIHFFIPNLVGNLLGVKGAKAAKDVYNYVFGIQKYAQGSATDVGAALNPIGSVNSGRFYYTKDHCEGSSLLKPEFWNQVKTWSILNQYTNAPLNELFTSFRTSVDGNVMPTLVFRQIPFTNEDFKGDGTTTLFLNLPRWKINSALVLEQDIGRDEAARINYVQYFGRSTLGKEGSDIAEQIAQGNYVYDVEDVQRSGLKPYIVTTQFDDPTSENKEYKSPKWAKILADALIDGHMKLNGSITCAGIVDPIAVGDNLEFDNVVYHIEQITHNASISPADGKITFRTMINLSSGISANSDSDGTVYAENYGTKAATLRIQDAKRNRILPGISESQDAEGRAQVDAFDDPEEDSPADGMPAGTPVGDFDTGDSNKGLA